MDARPTMTAGDASLERDTARETGMRDVSSDGDDAGCGDPALCNLPDGTLVGVVVDESASCPTGYGDPRPLHSGLMDMGCMPCAPCTMKTGCTLNLGLTTDLTTCSTPGAVFEGRDFVTNPGPACQPLPGHGNGLGTVVQSVVLADGQPSPNQSYPLPLSPVWTATKQFCSRPRNVSPAGPNECTLSAGGDGRCPDAFPKHADAYFSFYDDTRLCTCKGRILTTGRCDNVGIQVTAGTTCQSPSAILYAGQSDCSAIGTSNPPSFLMVGAPTNATCVLDLSESGFLSPSGPLTVCCR